MKYVALMLIWTLASLANASTMECYVNVIDGTAEGKTRITFKIKETDSGTRRHFTVQDGSYLCNLFVSNRRYGTSLACEYTNNLGRTFFQSDRSAREEPSQYNSLVFRTTLAYNRNQVIALDSDCHAVSAAAD
jgi:hypothetical protein